MKKILLIIGLTSISFLVKSQEKTKSYLIANGGMNYATFYQSSSAVANLGGVWGPDFGLSVRTIAPTWWGFEGGLHYSAKGSNFSDSTGKSHINYIEGFFDGLLVFPLANNDDAYVGIGVYTGYALNGKSKSDSTDNDIKFGDTWKRFDVGLQLRGGYMIKNTVGFGVRYDIGFVPVYTSLDLRGETNHGRNSVLNIFVSLKLAKIFEDK